MAIKFEVHVDGKLFCGGEDEKSVKTVYRLCIADLMSFGADGKKTVELRKVNEDGTYENSAVARINSVGSYAG